MIRWKLKFRFIVHWVEFCSIDVFASVEIFNSFWKHYIKFCGLIRKHSCIRWFKSALHSAMLWIKNQVFQNNRQYNVSSNFIQNTFKSKSIYNNQLSYATYHVCWLVIAVFKPCMWRKTAWNDRNVDILLMHNIHF